MKGNRRSSVEVLCVVSSLLAPPAFAAEPVGKAAFDRAGCSACHGVGASGSSFAPALAGHTAEQVKRYVRNPQGAMPRFGVDKISDADLVAISAYIAGLPLPPADVVGPDMAARIEMHHWIAHHALIANDTQHAVVHLTHLLELVTDAAHRKRIESILDLVQANRNQEAAYEVLQMMHAKVSPAMSIETMHLRLAVGALDAGDTHAARHYLEQYVQGTSGHNRRHAEELLILLDKGDVGSVKKRVAHLLGH